jgi:hypothetical protein
MVSYRLLQEAVNKIGSDGRTGSPHYIPSSHTVRMCNLLVEWREARERRRGRTCWQ